jgi:hypothetical protein
MSNPGFESPYVGNGFWGAFQVAPTGSAWVYTGGAGVSGNGSGFTSGNPSAPEGTQVAFLQDTGTFSQVFSQAAGTYTLSFMAAQRANYQFTSQTFQVFLDGGSLGTFSPSGTSYASYSTASFKLAAGTHTVKFVGLNPNGGDNTAFVDLLSLNLQGPPVGNDLGFEFPSVGYGSWGSFQIQPVGALWNFQGSAGLAGNGSGFTSGNSSAPDGTQIAFLQMTGSFSQSINLAAGAYTIDFQAAQRANWQSSSQTFEVLVDGKLIATIKPTGKSYSDYLTSGFAVTAGPHLVKFVGLNPNGGDNTAFIDSVRFNSFTPVQYNISFSVSGNVVSYSVLDTQRGITVSGYTVTDGTFTGLSNANGVVCWSSLVKYGGNFDHNTMGYVTYDSVQGRFITGSTRVDGVLSQYLNQSGVVCWTSTVSYFGSFDHNTVAVVRYDINRGSWVGAAYRVDGALLARSTLTAPNFLNVGGVVAWPSATYYFGSFDHNTVACATYDPALGYWVLNSSRVAGTLQAMSVAAGVVAWQSGNAPNLFTIAYTTYDPSRTSWRTASTSVYNIQTFTNSGGIVGWTWFQSGQVYSARRIYDKPSGLWKAI